MIPTLYLTRNGLLEPLGQSQVMAYLRGLSGEYQITLITYEKPEDWTDEARMAEAQADCRAHDIRWLPQRFQSHPKVIAPALSMMRMFFLVWRELRSGNAELIHARSYIPAAVALMVHRLTGTPFVFDMRALWPEELITAGRLKRGSVLHRVIIAVERACLARAASVVSLTHAAVVHLRQVYPQELDGQRIVVIPTCADLDRFRPRTEHNAGYTVHACIGTLLSGWFRTDWLAAWMSVTATKDTTARFDIVTRDNQAEVRSAVDPDGRLDDRIAISSRQPQQMPETVRGHDLSVMFFTEGLSKLGSSPTRMGEVLGSGLPIVANTGVGDVARIITEHRVGVLVEGPSPDDMAVAFRELELLMADPNLPKRCRAAAEALFSLEAGTESYRNLYADVLKAKDAVCAA